MYHSGRKTHLLGKTLKNDSLNTHTQQNIQYRKYRSVMASYVLIINYNSTFLNDIKEEDS